MRSVFAELGFNRLIDQLDTMGGSTGSSETDVAAVAAGSGLTTAEDFDYTCIDTPDALANLASQLADVGTLAVDTETTSVRPMWASLVGISLSWEPGQAVYIPVRGPLGAAVLPIEDVQAAVGPFLADPAVAKVGHNFKYDRIVLTQAGFDVAGDVFDTMIAAHVLDSSRITYKLDALAAELLGHQCIPIENIIGRGKNQITMDMAPMDIVAVYAAEDADITLRLAEALAPKLQAEGLDDLFRELEMPLMPVLAAMERDGIALDPQCLKKMEVKFSRRADELREEILELAGEEFNPDSPKQLATILFEKLELPVIKKNKTGPSTDASVLEELAIEHELPARLLDYRKLTKLLSTYLRGLATCIHPKTGRVHTSFHQAGTETGRLSSSDPNLQNIPIRTAEGRQIRSAFIAPEGHMLLAADYSQIELRILAHLCEDETMLAAFGDDQDIHRIVAAEVFGAPLDEVTPEQRSGAKGVNFGIIYGQTAFGLAKALRIPRYEAKEFIERYHARFPRIAEFLTMCIQQAKNTGYVTTLMGRRRNITEIESRNPQRRAAAERLAINSVVQGSAADLIKRAMINIAQRIEREDRPSRMLLQIHDELVFEIPTDAVDAEREMIAEEMSGAIELKAALKVDVGVGATWLDAK